MEQVRITGPDKWNETGRPVLPFPAGAGTMLNALIRPVSEKQSEEAEPMKVETQWQDENLVVMTEGRVDGTNATEFQDALTGAIQDGGAGVVLDFENLSYISSAGLRVILMVAKDLRRQGTRFAACSLIAPVRDVFVISGFDKIIPIHDTQEAAIGSFKK